MVCGVVVVEERDARGSSLGRSRRTGTFVHATPRDTGGGGGGGSVAVDLVGDAGTETYMFQRGRCKLFRSFVHHGKLTVCTAGMRYQVRVYLCLPKERHADDDVPFDRVHDGCVLVCCVLLLLLLLLESCCSGRQCCHCCLVGGDSGDDQPCW